MQSLGIIFQTGCEYKKEKNKKKKKQNLVEYVEHVKIRKKSDVKKARKKIKKFLAKNPSAINSVRTPRGNTALHMAVLNGSPELVQLLLDLVADKNIKNKKGRTYSQIAQRIIDRYQKIITILNKK